MKIFPKRKKKIKIFQGIQFSNEINESSDKKYNAKIKYVVIFKN